MSAPRYGGAWRRGAAARRAEVPSTSLPAHLRAFAEAPIQAHLTISAVVGDLLNRRAPFAGAPHAGAPTLLGVPSTSGTAPGRARAGSKHLVTGRPGGSAAKHLVTAPRDRSTRDARRGGRRAPSDRAGCSAARAARISRTVYARVACEKRAASRGHPPPDGRDHPNGRPGERLHDTRQPHQTRLEKSSRPAQNPPNFLGNPVAEPPLRASGPGRRFPAVGSLARSLM